MTEKEKIDVSISVLDELSANLRQYVRNIKTIRSDNKCFLTEENVLNLINEQKELILKFNKISNNLIRISETDDWVVDYDKTHGMYRVSLFENGHYQDEIWFDEVEKECLNE